MLRRYIHGISANAFGQIINTGIQILSVPIFITSWGIDKYGEWIMLFTIPLYLSKGGVNFSNAAANKIQIKIENSKNEEAGLVFQAAFNLTLFVTISILFILISLCSFFDLKELLNFHTLNRYTLSYTLIILSIYVFCCIFTDLLMGTYRATGKYATGVFIVNIIRGFEYVFACLMAFYSKSIIYTAICFLIVRFIGNTLFFHSASKQFSFVRLSVSLSQRIRQELKKIFRPSLSFAGFAFGDALSDQGVIVLIGLVLGPVEVAMYSVVKTLANLCRQISFMITNPIWPEYTRLLIIKEYSKVKQINRILTQTIFIILGIAGLFAVAMKDFIFGIWTNNSLIPSSLFLTLVLIYTILSALWRCNSAIFISINKQGKLSRMYIISSLLSLILVYLFMGKLELYSIPAVLLPVHFILLIYVSNKTCILLKDRLLTYWKSVLFRNVAISYLKSFSKYGLVFKRK